MSAVKQTASDSWLGQLPFGWTVQRLGSLGTLIKGQGGSKEDNRVEGIPVVRYGDLYTKKFGVTIEAPVAFVSGADVAKYTPLLQHDIVFAASGESAEDIGKSAVSLLDGPAVVGGDTLVLRLSAEVDAIYLAYALESRPLRATKAIRATGFTVVHLSAGRLKTLPIPIPPAAEQRAIAGYLDRETARIDTLIDEQFRLISLLREQRGSIVDSALAGHGFQGPSSLQGAERYVVPEGWRIVLLGRVLRQLTNGFVGPTRDILMEDGIRYIQGTHIKAGRIDFDRRPFYVSREWHEERPRIHLLEGDVLIVQTGDVGRVAVVPPGFGEASCHALQIARVRPELLSGEYLAAFLTSRLGYNSLLLRASGALHPHLEAGIREVPVIVPPKEIQEAIVNESAEQTAKVDNLIAETERFIDLAIERRSALVTAAVTGQIDVRAVA